MIRTRFAPSPSGYLHIGGVRTALFNWLIARQNQGQFILRIDDTDHQRNVTEALQPILDGFRWLGLDWDEGPEVGGSHGPYFQSQRTDLYQSAATQLLATGHAYRDYATTDEIQQQREAAKQSGKAFVYDRQWMAEDESMAKRFEAEGRSFVVRLKMPREGECVFQDAVRGEIRVPWASEQDHAIQRADGSCLYHLASVVDDHAMHISDVIRAAEHLPNTPRQIFIAQSLNYSLPRYAHLPYVAEPGGTAKLSKRKLKRYLKIPEFQSLMELGNQIAEKTNMEVHPETFNPVLVDFYREIGFLPEALLNYLLLLGWSLDGETEQFDKAAMLTHFSLNRINHAPASFDPQKLLAFQADRMQSQAIDDKTQRVLPYLQQARWVASPPTSAQREHTEKVVTAAGERIKIAGDILNYGYCFLNDNTLDYDEKSFVKRIIKPAEAIELLSQFQSRLDAIEPFDAATTEISLKQFCEESEIPIGKIIHALRVAVTGQATGFGMFETLEILGRPLVRSRIQQAIHLGVARRQNA